MVSWGGGGDFTVYVVVYLGYVYVYVCGGWLCTVLGYLVG